MYRKFTYSLRALTLFGAGLFSLVAVPTVAAEISPVIAKGEEFVRDGKPLRFWGVNVTIQPWLTGEAIDAEAKRINKVGFNAVRLWTNSTTLYGVDLRTGPAPSQGFALKEYELGDGSQLDLFDRAVHRFRQQGLSIFTTLLSYYPPYFTTEPFVDIITTTPEDRAAWIQAMSGEPFPRGIYDPSWVLHFIDSRMQAIRLKHANLILNHVNKYTGLRYADDNNIAAWQILHESRFLDKFLGNNEFRIAPPNGRAFPLYFQNKLKKQYNQFLLNRYGTTAALSAAWGGLVAGESLEAGSIDPGVRNAANVPYNNRRAKDFLEFGVKIVRNWNARLINFIRSHATDPKQGVGVAPIAADGYGSPSMTQHAAAYNGNMVQFGSYPDPQLAGFVREFEPWAPFTARSGAWAPYDTVRPADKPAIIYEANYNSYNMFDAELPWLEATYASWQNISGIFWFLWNAPRPDEMPDPYGTAVFDWRDAEIWGDETFSAALQAAGTAFIKRMLPQAENPTVLSFRRDLAYDQAWRYWTYRPPVDATPPRLKGLTVEQAKGLTNFIAGTAWTTGIRTQFVAEQEEDVVVTGPLHVARFGGDFEFSPGVQWLGTQTKLFIDKPKIKVYVGFPSEPSISWSDGFSINNLNLAELGQGDMHYPFVVASFTSLDGLPLADSKQVRVSVLSHSHHADIARPPPRSFRVVPGTGPVVVRRVTGNISLPHKIGRQARYRNFAFETIKQTTAETGLVLSPGDPIYDIILETRAAP